MVMHLGAFGNKGFHSQIQFYDYFKKIFFFIEIINL